MTTELVLVLVGVAVAIALYFAFARRKPAELPGESARPPALDKPASERPKAAPAKPAKPKARAEDEEAKPAKAPPPPPAAKTPDEPPPAPKSTPKKPRRPRDVEGLRLGLGRARDKEGFFGRLKALFSGKKEIDPDLVGRIEEVLITSDVGVKTTERLLATVREAVGKDGSDADKVWTALREEATRLLEATDVEGGPLRIAQKPTVVMMVGVNGVGKTTTIGKLATKLKAEGKTVVLAAGDTFRAAAVEQLGIWSKRVGCEVVAGKDGANPGAVIFDAIQKAKEIGADVVLADTAGRLHTKVNLMEELQKVAKTMNKALEGSPHETLLVLDATNGQNALQQAAMFHETLPLTGLVLTKLDGTAKGGIVLGVSAEQKVPVRYIGIGERAEDLRDFDAEEFVEALLGAGPDAGDEAAA